MLLKQTREHPVNRLKTITNIIAITQISNYNYIKSLHFISNPILIFVFAQIKNSFYVTYIAYKYRPVLNNLNTIRKYLPHSNPLKTSSMALLISPKVHLALAAEMARSSRFAPFSGNLQHSVRAARQASALDEGRKRYKEMVRMKMSEREREREIVYLPLTSNRIQTPYFTNAFIFLHPNQRIKYDFTSPYSFLKIHPSPHPTPLLRHTPHLTLILSQYTPLTSPYSSSKTHSSPHPNPLPRHTSNITLLLSQYTPLTSPYSSSKTHPSLHPTPLPIHTPHLSLLISQDTPLTSPYSSHKTHPTHLTRHTLLISQDTPYSSPYSSP